MYSDCNEKRQYLQMVFDRGCWKEVGIIKYFTHFAPPPRSLTSILINFISFYIEISFDLNSSWISFYWLFVRIIMAVLI